jgi:hypothetical protein
MKIRKRDVRNPHSFKCPISKQDIARLLWGTIKFITIFTKARHCLKSHVIPNPTSHVIVITQNIRVIVSLCMTVLWHRNSALIWSSCDTWRVQRINKKDAVSSSLKTHIEVTHRQQIHSTVSHNC